MLFQKTFFTAEDAPGGSDPLLPRPRIAESSRVLLRELLAEARNSRSGDVSGGEWGHVGDKTVKNVKNQVIALIYIYNILYLFKIY